MKKLYLPVIPLLLHLFLSAQSEITVSTGTDLFLPAGTVFSAGGLALAPSSDFTLNGMELTKTATVSHATVNNYVSRVYNFSNTSSPFTGTVQFYYSDAELNGLNEAGLTVNIHDGSVWQPVNSTTNDVTNNYVLTNAVVNRTLNELALGDDAFATLPLQWGNIYAYREEKTVKIDWTTRQEFDVNYFTVERSEDGRNWSVVADHVRATNTLTEQYYSVTDNSSPSSLLYYRVKQTDIDGKATYSPLAIVAAENERGKLLLYPNPVTNVFYISNVSAGMISRINLYNNIGVLVRTWVAAQAYYDIHDVAAGIYHVRAEMKDSSNQYFKITK
jgi:Secretion system C-terminal sorting domain